MEYKKCPNGHYYKEEVCPQCGYGAQPVQEIVPEKPSNFLAQSILVTVLCFAPLGIPAIVYAAQVDPLWGKGDYERALFMRSRAKLWCKRSLITGIILWAVVITLYVIYFIALIGIIAADI